MIIPPFAGVRLVEYRDRIELTPVYWFREFVGYGRFNTSRVGPAPEDDLYPFYKSVMGNREIWVIAVWRRYENGQEEAIRLQYLDPEATEEKAKTEFTAAIEFQNLTKRQLEDLTECFQATEEDIGYIEDRFPNIQDAATLRRSTERSDLYQARLKVLAGMHPKTVDLLRQADEATDISRRRKLEHEAVQAYFAEMAHFWTEDQVTLWQRSNPIGTQWMCEFSRVLNEPKRKLDPVNYELALNWLRRGYNLLTASELADALRQATKEKLRPATVKKRRERLGLTTKRPPGPPPKGP